MRNFLLLALAALTGLALITAETKIEVDEHGDEFELKRFYIQGRQLNGNKSQCVVTRRKRSGTLTNAAVLPSVAVSSQKISLSEPSNAQLMEHREGVVNLAENLSDNQHRYVDLMALTNEDQDDDEYDDDFEDEDENAEDDEEEQQQQQSEQQKGSGSESFVPAIALPLGETTANQLPQGVSVVASAATHANVGSDVGIVVVQSHNPPQVNPGTHAVFELKPVKQPAPEFNPYELHEDDYDDEHFYIADHDDGAFSEQFITEDSPVSTTAIWSTGDDNEPQQPVGNRRRRPNGNKGGPNRKNKNKRGQQQQLNKRRKQQALEAAADKPNKQRPNKNRKPQHDLDLDSLEDALNEQQALQKKKKKQPASQNDDDIIPQKPKKKRRPAGSNSSSSSVFGASSSSSSASTSNKKKRRPSSSSSSSSTINKRNKKKSSKNKKKKKKTSVSNPNRRRKPSSSSSSSSSSGARPVGGYRRRRPQQQQLQQQKRRRQEQLRQKRRRQEQQRRRRQRLREKQRQREYFGNEPIINCIYINKDEPTTQRPFWNILGRDSEAASSTPAPPEQPMQQRTGFFGQRKRTNLRFVA